LLAEREKAKGAQGNPGGQGAKIVPSNDARAQTLSDLGVSYQQSSDWQKIAAIPEDEFEAMVGGPEKPTTRGLVKAVSSPPKKPITPVDDKALWLWGT